MRPDNSTRTTSPFSPYNVGIQYDVLNDRMPWTYDESVSRRSCAEIARILVPTGRLSINVTPVLPGDAGRVGQVHLWSSAVLEAGLGIRDYVVWSIRGRGGSTAWGSWRSPSGPNMLESPAGASAPWRTTAPFPEALARRAIRLSTWPGEGVLDPSCGSSPTGPTPSSVKSGAESNLPATAQRRGAFSRDPIRATPTFSCGHRTDSCRFTVPTCP